MADTDRVFTGSIPEFYDTRLVPMLFEVYARDLAARARREAPVAVIETAAGSGVVTRALAGALPPGARITATDLNPAMLERAQSRQEGDQRIEWRPADALALPFGDASFDAGLCQFGVMFFPDRVRGYAEMHRVLNRGAPFLFNIWDGIESNGIADTITRALAELWSEDPPLFLARTPHGHGDADLIRSELEQAGFSDIRIESMEAISPASDARTAATAYCQGTPLRAEIEARDPDGLDRATAHAAAAVAREWGSGPIEAPTRALVIEAR